MRAISLVDRIELEFNGNVVKNAISLGDVDNDGNNELIVGGESGEVAIFKGKERWQTITGLSFVSCLAVGDILNQNKNCLVILTADGWCHIYQDVLQYASQSESLDILPEKKADDGVEQVDGIIFSGGSMGSEKSVGSDSVATSSDDKPKHSLKRIHVQRIPANSMDILLGDIDGDGMIELVLGLTDRVVRSYRWYNNPDIIKSGQETADTNSNLESIDKLTGRLVGQNKWECANQIGSVTLHHNFDGTPTLLVAQPGGTFMRITCQSEENIMQSETANEQSDSASSRSETLAGSSVDYEFLGISRMRNQNISTEILGDLRSNVKDIHKTTGDRQIFEISPSFSTSMSGTANKDFVKDKCKSNPYAVATLDGTIMLVQNEVILWAIAVDHQIFVLNKLDVTGNGCDDIIACSWDGHTYILDQQKHSVRFQFDESVQAFESGTYTLNDGEIPVRCLVYVTFHNKIYLYYDLPLKEMILKRFEPDMTKLSDLFLDDKVPDDIRAHPEGLSRKCKKQLVEYLLYDVKC